MELHSRLQNRFDFTALVTDEFPNEYRAGLEGVKFVCISPDRGTMFKVREILGIPYKEHLVENKYDIWAEEVPPAPDTGRLKLVLTVHDLRHSFGLRFATVRRYLNLALRLRKSMSRSSAIIAVSRATASEIISRYGFPECAVHVIPNGIDSDISSRPALPNRLFPKPFILAVGHLEKRKNYSILVSAFSTIARKWDGILVFAGKDSGIGDRLKAKALEEGVSDRVRFTGSVSDIELWSLFRDCEILACPSLYEGFGMTLLEGMAMNRPVVASRIPAHVEVAGNAAYLVDTHGDMIEGFAQALLSVLEDQEMKGRLVISGRKRVGMFSWDSSAEKLSQLYTSLASEAIEILNSN